MSLEKLKGKSSKNPEISVIVPVYNTELYLEECIDSILNQTFKDFELILVNDGSKDNSYGICQKYAEKDARIRLYTQENSGQSAARNTGIRIACGRYISFVDSDDAIHSRYLELLFKAMLRHSAGIVTCSVSRNPHLLKETFEQGTYQELVYADNVENTILHFLSHAYWGGNVCGKLFQREIVSSELFEEGRIYEDNAIMCKWLYQSKVTVAIDVALYYYRENPTSTVNCPFTEKHLDAIWATRTRLDFLKEKQLYRVIPHGYKLYLWALSNGYSNVIKYLQDRSLSEKIEDELRQALHERRRYGVSFRDVAAAYEIIYPRGMRWYWMFDKLRKRFKSVIKSGLYKKDATI